MADLASEERNEKIRNLWLERIVQNEKNISNKLKEESLPFNKFLEIEQIQRKEQELKKRIEDGYTPDEPPAREYKPVDGIFVHITAEDVDESDRGNQASLKNPTESDFIFVCPELKDDKKSQPMPENQENGSSDFKLISRICKLLSRK